MDKNAIFPQKREESVKNYPHFSKNYPEQQSYPHKILRFRVVNNPQCGEVIHRKTGVLGLKTPQSKQMKKLSTNKGVQLSTFLKKWVWTTPIYPHFGGKAQKYTCITPFIFVCFDKIYISSTNIYGDKKTSMWINNCNVENF